MALEPLHIHYQEYTEEVHTNNMSQDSGTIAAAVAVIGSLLTMLGAGNLVPLVGPAAQGILAVVTLAVGMYSWYSHAHKSAVIAAGI